MPAFFSRLNYSFGNEDWSTEKQALKIKSGDRVLCITASGDRSLHPLAYDCDVTSVDANPIQNYLLDLKKAAMQKFSYDEYLSFLGALPSKDRTAQLNQLASVMKPEAAKYWLNNKSSIEAGILFQGALERMTKKTSRILKIMKGSKIKQLFDFHNVDKQRPFIEQNWNTYYLRKLFDICLHPFVTKWLINDPGLYVPTSLSLGAFVHKKIQNCLERHPAKECALLSMILTGNVSHDAFPPYLTREGYNRIKPNLNRVSYQTDNVVSYLESAQGNSFDAFSISDVASYLSKEEFLRLLKGIQRTAKPGARFSIRQVLSDHHIPESISDSFQRDHELEKKLEDEDRCFVYRYFVGHVNK